MDHTGGKQPAVPARGGVVPRRALTAFGLFNGTHITAAATAGHHIHIDEPPLVIPSIREVVNAIQ
jgi:hypothetical protein